MHKALLLIPLLAATMHCAEQEFKLPVDIHINFKMDQNVAAPHVSTVTRSVELSSKGQDFMKHPWVVSSGSFIARNKGWCALAGIGAVYTTLLYFVFKGNSFLQKTDTWSAWRNELTLEQLLMQPQYETAEQLMRAIQARYTNQENPTDFILPLTQFLRAIEQEKKQIKRYTKLTTWLNRLYLKRIFPITTAKQQQADDALKKLAYLQGLFSSWIADYKMVRNAPAAG